MLLGGAAFAVMGRARTGRAATSPYRLTLYRDPHCACCLDWVAVIEKTFVVEMVTSRPLAEVNKQLEEKMVEAYNAVLKMSLRHKTDMRTAAYVVAIDRVATVTRLRGMYA